MSYAGQLFTLIFDWLGGEREREREIKIFERERERERERDQNMERERERERGRENSGWEVHFLGQECRISGLYRQRLVTPDIRRRLCVEAKP